jgi:UDP-N-acetyl-alpha-D-quinovosamine dehydrogenase
MNRSGKFMVTGANGFVGATLCRALLKQDRRVVAVVRQASDIPRNPEPGGSLEACAVGDIGPRTEWTDCFHGADIVIHLAARVHVMDHTAGSQQAFRTVNVRGTERLARAAAANGVRRFVFASTVKVNGENTVAGQKFTEQDAPAPSDNYAVSKWEAEQVLHRIADETGLEVVIVRPPLVYGPGVKGNFTLMLSAVARGIPLPFASVANLRSLVYVENLADALIACATQPAAAGQTYLVCDGEDVSTPDLLRRVGVEIGVPARLFPCRPALLRLAGRLAGKSRQMERLLESLQADSGKIRRELNWVPPCSLQHGLQTAAAWYRSIYK